MGPSQKVKEIINCPFRCFNDCKNGVNEGRGIAALYLITHIRRHIYIVNQTLMCCRVQSSLT